MQPHFCSLWFAFGHIRMSQPDKEDSQNASLAFSPVLLTSFYSCQPFHFSSHIHTASKIDFLSMLSCNIVWRTRSFRTLSITGSRMLSWNAFLCFYRLWSCFIDSSSFVPLFHILIETRHVSGFTYHLSVSALGCWAYRRVLAYLNTFASHTNVTESGAVALVAMQLLN